MRIVMFTNLYLPKVGGVSISVDRFSEAYRQRGHEVLIVAPNFPGQDRDAAHVARVSAIQNFNGTDFSVALPPGRDLAARLDEFAPDLIHSHHPFLLGDSAVRTATRMSLPLVYTHHTRYEYYTHYVPLDSDVLKSFVVQLSTRYAEFCSLVIAPSESIAEILRDRGVTSPIEVVPTGVVIEDFSSGDGSRGRRTMGIDKGDIVIGHVGRLAEEKNLGFLTRCVIRALHRIEGSRFLVVGSGDSEPVLREMLEAEGLGDRGTFAGTQTGQDLADLYAAMDVFVFASKSETQGMVLAEALAAGTPLVALDAPGAREVVVDGENGRLVNEEDEGAFAEAVGWVCELSDSEAQAMRQRAREHAQGFSLDRCVDRALEAYERALQADNSTRQSSTSDWDTLLQSIQREWEIWSNRAASLSEAITEPLKPEEGDV